MRSPLVVVLLAGCGFELRPGGAVDPTGDAAVDSPMDAPIDARIDGPTAPPPDAPFAPATDCPAAYSISLSGQTSRYRVLVTGRRPWEHAADCADDLVGATHLVALDSAAEIAAVQARITATTGLPGGQGSAWVGSFQPRMQANDDTGWLKITGGPITPMWDPGEPNDGDNTENSAENYMMMERNRQSQVDVPGDRSFGAVCECDGLPVDAAAAAAMIASMN